MDGHCKADIARVDVVLKPDGTIERPEKRLEKQVVLDRYGLLPRDLRSIDACESLSSQLVLHQLTFPRIQTHTGRSTDTSSAFLLIQDRRSSGPLDSSADCWLSATLQVCKKSIIIVTPIIRAIIAHDDCVLIVNDSSNPISSIDGEDQLIKAIGGVLKYLEITGSALGNGKQVPFELRYVCVSL